MVQRNIKSYEFDKMTYDNILDEYEVAFISAVNEDIINKELINGK